MENIYLGRQPILNSNGDLLAYEILYRDSDPEKHTSHDSFANASVISSILNKFGTKNLLGNRRAFVRIDEKFLLHDLIFSIPKEFFIFSLYKDVKMSERVVERLKLLHSRDYTLAINNVTLSPRDMKEYAKVYKELSYVKINLDKDIDLDTKEMINELKAHDIRVVGAKIEDNAHYLLAKELGCEMFQGYFFAKPNIIENEKYEPSQVSVLKLYNLLISDTAIDEIASEFENNYEITVQLIRYMNSCSFSVRNTISSINHILTLVGRQQLAQWLMMMIYSKSVSKTSKHSPLILMVKNRTELMEKILKAVDPYVKDEILGEAYLVGILSLVETLFGVSLNKILEDLNISNEVAEALLKDEGILGEIYALIRDIEAFNTASVHIFTSKYNLGTHQIEDIVLKSMEDVNSFEEAMTL